MQRNEFIQWFEKEIKVRWPKCHFEWTEIGDWHWRLEKFDADALTEAVRRHKVCEDYRQPSLKKVYAYARTITAAKTPEQAKKKSSGIPDAHTYIICVAKGDNGCGCVGAFVPILIWPFTKTYTPETYRRVAEEQRVMHSRNGRNGIWEIFYNTTHLEMMTRRMKLRGTKPLNLNQLRKFYKNKP